MILYNSIFMITILKVLYKKSGSGPVPAAQGRLFPAVSGSKSQGKMSNQHSQHKMSGLLSKKLVIQSQGRNCWRVLNYAYRSCF